MIRLKIFIQQGILTISYYTSMNKLFLLYVFCFAFMIANAQVVSLKTNEIGKLKKLILKDQEVNTHWQALLKTADQSLSDTPNPADTILSEGILQGDPRKTKTWKCLEDMSKVYALGIAYKVNGDQKYLTKASEFLLAWASRNKPQGNPINDTNLERIIFTFDLLKKDLKPAVVLAVSAWLSEVAKQEIKTYTIALTNKGGAKSINNWHSHRIKEITQIAYALSDNELKHKAIEYYLHQISSNLKADGSSFDFHERDALHYHIYDVDPLLVAATILNREVNNDIDFYSYVSKEGNSLKKSVNWLLPYYTSEKTHAEWVNSKSAFDKKRAENGEKAYIAGTLFKPIEARTSIALAGYFDSDMINFYRKEANTNAKYPSWQFVLNEVKRTNR